MQAREQGGQFSLCPGDGSPMQFVLDGMEYPFSFALNQGGSDTCVKRGWTFSVSANICCGQRTSICCAELDIG